jgi:hypothetical protein
MQITGYAYKAAIVEGSLKKNPVKTEYGYRELCLTITAATDAMQVTLDALVLITPGRKRPWLKKQLEKKRDESEPGSAYRDNLHSAVLYLDQYFRVRSPRLF